ncbi:unnamed protein product [Acanthoscelides obtectus]|uniref:PDZ domain-containing protein n=1 Tax=Acanthoscelides obtectus TaxID=200917 RepID=A0A9P0KDR0_ACAOB|nr:unnamed protein product [Acanthoscelides obtectus]CAK1648214.1 hypothetical protein AOBTE_LOCUS15606 [Acanthoscelides obtectus]
MFILNFEFFMASIEVSLSSTPRRKKNGSISGVSLGSSIRSIPKELALKELENLRNALRDKENIIQSLRGQITLPGLRLNAIRAGSNGNNVRELTEVEKKQAEDRLLRLKTDIDNKRLAIKNLKMALERLDITDNIDVRIQQAELEYQLGREELNLLTLLEETRALQLCIDESNKASSEAYTLYSCIEGSDYVILQAVSVDYDPKSPKFGAGQRENVPGLYIDWALEGSNLKKDDRLIELNGKIVLNKNVEDLQRLLAAAPDPAQMVVLRKLTAKEEVLTIAANPSKEVLALKTELEEFRDRAEEAQKAKEGLRTDNIRLTHRISYLEEQVSELLSRKPPEQDVRVVTTAPVVSKTNQNVTSINISSQSPISNGHSEVQIFQKGNQITALVPTNNHESKESSYPTRSKSSLSNVSSTHIPAPVGEHHCQKGRHRHRQMRNGVQSPVGQMEKVSYRKHNHHHCHKEKDYSSETNSAIEQTKRYNRRNYENHQNHRYSGDFTFKANSEQKYASDIMDKSYKKATQIVHELTRSNNLYEKHRQQCITASEKYNADILKHYNARKSTSVIDFRSEVRIGPKFGDSKSVEELDTSEPPRNLERTYKKVQDARSVKSLDFDSDCNSSSARFNGHISDTNYASEGCYSENVNSKTRPTPPKKPARLSLHKTAQMSDDKERKSMKRNHNGEVNGQITWNFRRSIENSLEQDSWC